MMATSDFDELMMNAQYHVESSWHEKNHPHLASLKSSTPSMEVESMNQEENSEYLDFQFGEIKSQVPWQFKSHCDLKSSPPSPPALVGLLVIS